MSDAERFDRRDIERERDEILQQLEDWLEVPLLVLSFIWLALFVIELVWGLPPLLDILSLTIWGVFVLDFALEFLLAPRKWTYLERNWLTAFSLLLPALRVFRVVKVVRVLQTTRAVRVTRLLRTMTGMNRGMRALASSVQRRGFGYALGLTGIVTLAGAAGIYTFEREVSGSPLTDYGTALWWTAMVMTTMGADYFPKTPEGRVLCFLLALYAFAVFGYVTATLATFFVGRDAEDPNAEVAGTGEISALREEITALREEIRALSLSRLRRESERFPRDGGDGNSFETRLDREGSR